MQIPWGNEWTLLLLVGGILLVLFLLAPAVTKQAKKKRQYPLTVSATIEKVLDDDLDHSGGTHQRLFIRVAKVLDNPENAPVRRNENIFVAMRYGDRDGFPVRLHTLDRAAGEHIEIRGKYIPADPANKKAPSAVIHFTHKPFGYVRYANKTYR